MSFMSLRRPDPNFKYFSVKYEDVSSQSVNCHDQQLDAAEHILRLKQNICISCTLHHFIVSGQDMIITACARGCCVGFSMSVVLGAKMN